MATPKTKTAAGYAGELEALERDIARHLKAGEIDKPAYERIKYQADRAIERTSNVIAEVHLWGKGGALYEIARDDTHWCALLGAIPLHYARDVLSLGNKLSKVKAEELKGHAFYKDCAAYHGRYKDVAAKVLKLKDKIVTATKRREQKKDAAEQMRKAVFIEHKTLVVVLQEHLDAYVTKAGKMAARSFASWMEEMAAVEWDINRVAPEPALTETDKASRYKARRRAFLLSITDPVPDKWPLRKESLKKKAEYVARAKDAAHDSYMEWIYKMIQKIGQPVTAAEMHGNPWINSTITVTCRDRSKQVWHTKMIINRSKYNYPFNQFPSRRTDA